jgi:selenide, water dikinase
VLSDIPAQNDDRVLVGFSTADDAGVFTWEGGPALVQTVDFFTPIVDDPYTYGQIAAANAVSDVYAMGGRPLTALAIAAFPKQGLDRDVMRAILRGGFDMLREAGVALLGGHTVQDNEIKFGYAVTGAIDPARILTNAGARPGDALFLTKRLGTGIVGTAIKFERAPSVLIEQAIDSMRTLNRAAAEAIAALPAGVVHACTDVTGFGLAGHGTEMARASGVTLEIEVDRLPLFEGVVELAAQNRSGGFAANHDHFAGGVGVGHVSDTGRKSSQDARVPLIYDPQTSGGLLVAVRHEAADVLAEAFAERGVSAWQVGRAIEAIPPIHIHMV